jgi:hypothetical protein
MSMPELWCWARPVRNIPTYKNQANYPGWLWSATMGLLVGYESLLKRDRPFGMQQRHAMPRPAVVRLVRRHLPHLLRRPDGPCEGPLLVLASLCTKEQEALER